MNKKRILIAICLLALTMISLAWAKQQAPQPSKGDQSAQGRPTPQQPEVPDEVVYRHLLNHVLAFKKKAEEVEREGKDGNPFRKYFKHKANLNDYEAQTLDEIASDYDKEVKL